MEKEIKQLIDDYNKEITDYIKKVTLGIEIELMDEKKKLIANIEKKFKERNKWDGIDFKKLNLERTDKNEISNIEKNIEKKLKEGGFNFPENDKNEYPQDNDLGIDKKLKNRGFNFSDDKNDDKKNNYPKDVVSWINEWWQKNKKDNPKFIYKKSDVRVSCRIESKENYPIGLGKNKETARLDCCQKIYKSIKDKL